MVPVFSLDHKHQKKENHPVSGQVKDVEIVVQDKTEKKQNIQLTQRLIAKPIVPHFSYERLKK